AQQDFNLESSMANRLLVIFNHLSKEERQQTYALLNKRLAEKGNLAEMAGNFRYGRNSEVADFTYRYPGINRIAKDLVDFGETLPGVYSHPQADQIIFNFLNFIVSLEKASGRKDADFLKQQVLGAHLKGTIINTLINVAERGNQTGWISSL